MVSMIKFLFLFFGSNGHDQGLWKSLGAGELRWGGNQVQGQGLGGSLGKWWVWRWLKHSKLWLDLAIPCVLSSLQPPAELGLRTPELAPESSLWVSYLLLQVPGCSHFGSTSYIVLDLCLPLTQRLEISRLDSLFHRPPACSWPYGSIWSIHQTWLSSSWPLTLITSLSPYKLSPCSQIWIRLQCFLGPGSDQSSVQMSSQYHRHSKRTTNFYGQRDFFGASRYLEVKFVV